MSQDHRDAVTADSYARLLAAATPRELGFRATDPSTLLRWQQALRARLVQQLGIPHIAARCSEAPAVTKRGEVLADDHVREDWEFVPEPGFCVPFFLLRPLDAKGRRPLVLTPHGHSKRGRYVYSGITESPEARASMVEGERDIALQAVREGYVVIAPQARAFDEDRGRREVQQDATSSCTDWQMKALMFGRTLIGERVWDIMRLIDYAETRSDVDLSRIAITGNSGGGTISLFAAAVDERISVAVPSCYFCTFLDSIGAMHHCPCNYFPGMAGLAEMADLAGLVAPRPFLAVSGQRDEIFPIDAAREAFAHLKRIYEVAGVPERCELYEGDGGHRYYKAPVWPFVARHLG